MPSPPAPPSARSAARAAARERRETKQARREAIFEGLVSGLTQEMIAKDCEISLATLRREIDREMARRAVDPP